MNRPQCEIWRARRDRTLVGVKLRDDGTVFDAIVIDIAGWPSFRDVLTANGKGDRDLAKRVSARREEYVQTR